MAFPQSVEASGLIFLLPGMPQTSESPTPREIPDPELLVGLN
jgi:hypothetical protein